MRDGCVMDIVNKSVIHHAFFKRQPSLFQQIIIFKIEIVRDVRDILRKNRKNFWRFQYFFVLLPYQSVRFNRKQKFIMKIIVSEEIESVCPTFVGACVEANVVNTPYCQELWDEIHALGEKYKETLTTESLKEMSGIAATRKVYRACGKDPSRYRPASEALIRRILQGKELYQRDTLVDLVNLASIAYGYSIGGFDTDKFEGDTLTLGVGKAGEPYEGIGRGMINIEGLPVYRDKIGGVGTPTSDNERTKMNSDTTHLVVLINGYDGDEQHVRENAEFIIQLLKKYCQSDGGSYFIYK